MNRLYFHCRLSQNQGTAPDSPLLSSESSDFSVFVPFVFSGLSEDILTVMRGERALAHLPCLRVHRDCAKNSGV